eukprot:10925999-Lingulodinium_polyedra.AAC.1
MENWRGSGGGDEMAVDGARGTIPGDGPVPGNQDIGGKTRDGARTFADPLDPTLGASNGVDNVGTMAIQGLPDEECLAGAAGDNHPALFNGAVDEAVLG